MKVRVHIIIFIILLGIPRIVFSQSKIDTVQIKAIDSVKIIPITPQVDTSKTTTMTKSPFGAVARSLVLPGWGQYYVESYWKIPVFVGGMGFLTYLIIDNNNKYNDARREVDNYQKQSDYDFHYDYLIRKREYYRDNRDQSIFILAGVYLLAAVDAYVGANLFDFNVSEDLSINLIPKDSKYLALNIRLKF